MTGAIGNVLLILSDSIDRASRIIMIFIMSVMVVTILGQVFFRYILNSALPWPEELTIFLMSWMTFIGSGIALKAWQHIGITLFANMLPQNFQVILSILVKVAVLFFAVFLTYTGIILVQKSTNIVSEAMRISMIWPRLSLPVGGVIMVIHTVNLLYQELYSIFRKN
jgi:TRAP-type C4-dicarboxylate transport system permease small subunit